MDNLVVVGICNYKTGSEHGRKWAMNAAAALFTAIITKAKALPVLIIVCLAVAVFMKEVWISLFTVGILYILSIPFSFWACRNDLRKLKN